MQLASYLGGAGLSINWNEIVSSRHSFKRLTDVLRKALDLSALLFSSNAVQRIVLTQELVLQMRLIGSRSQNSQLIERMQARCCRCEHLACWPNTFIAER